ncbi:Rhodopirellula transposase [Tautonia plasticadhaerens]|uniref:Rhodopirellula transposase n=1 Tax=Tautonia plasticadhaerens TaxID=2527974 RepID=A0A518H199_9BACT|nr:Rhodopirellula transposase [Tautonia plasticadhaerens]
MAVELQAREHAASERSVNRLLHGLGYSLQSNRKTIEGKGHPDRDAQFQHINRRVKAFQRQGQPVVSVDAKKKELVGQFRNGGREWQPQGQTEGVDVCDFVKKDLGKAIPYGVYDQTTDSGWVSVGVDHDTAEFAVETLRRWWRNMGHRVYPHAERLLITADGGGSNGTRCRLWEVELQGLADVTGLRISACHFPPVTSKWNKIEHRMFCYITENWRGRPLVSREVVVNLIGHTTTKTGLAIRSELDEGSYLTGRKVSDEQMEGLSIKRDKFHGDKFHGEWNYSILPRQQIE